MGCQHSTGRRAGRGHQGEVLELVAPVRELRGQGVVFPPVRETLVVERLEDDLDLLLEQLPVRVLVHHDAAQGFDFAGVVAAPDPEGHPAAGEDVGGSVVLGEPERVPHRADVEATADPQSLGHVGEVHGHHQDVRHALVALVLEVVLGEPEGVVAEPIHAAGERLGLREHRRQVLVRVAAIVRRSRILAHVAEIDVAGVERREPGDHRMILPRSCPDPGPGSGPEPAALPARKPTTSRRRPRPPAPRAPLVAYLSPNFAATARRRPAAAHPAGCEAEEEPGGPRHGEPDAPPAGKPAPDE